MKMTLEEAKKRFPDGPEPSPLELAGQWVAWSKDRTRIVAHGAKFGEVRAEAIAAGCYPLLPRRLSYPELLHLADNKASEQFFYDGSVDALANKLMSLAEQIKTSSIWPANITPDSLTNQYKWNTLAPKYDNALENLS